MRLDKLARRLRAHQNATRKQTDTGQRQLRDQIADLDRRIGLQITALERGIEPDLIGQRIAGLRDAKSTVRRRARPRCSCASRNLALALQRAPPGINGQVVVGLVAHRDASPVIVVIAIPRSVMAAWWSPSGWAACAWSARR